MRTGGFWGWERRQVSRLRLKWHKGCSLAVMVTGAGLGTPRWPPGPGAAGLGGCCQNHGSPEGNSQGTVLVSALPAFLLLPEPGCTLAPEPGANPGRAPALGVTSRAICEALVILPAGRNTPREPGLKPPSHGEGRPQETLIYLLAELRL